MRTINLLFMVSILSFIPSCFKKNKQESEQKVSSTKKVEERKKTEVSPNLDVLSFKEKMQENGVVVLDVRTEAEWKGGVIADAQRHDFYSPTFQEWLTGFELQDTYLIYCAAGGRSGKTLKKMKKMGFTQVFHLKGGFRSWKGAGEAIAEYSIP